MRSTWRELRAFKLPIQNNFQGEQEVVEVLSRLTSICFSSKDANSRVVAVSTYVVLVTMVTGSGATVRAQYNDPTMTTPLHQHVLPLETHQQFSDVEQHALLENVPPELTSMLGEWALRAGDSTGAARRADEGADLLRRLHVHWVLT